MGLAAGTVTTPPSAHQAAHGWYGLLDIYREAADEFAQQRTQRPLACPNDGEPLTTGPGGTLFCKYDGFVWDGVNR